MQLGPIAVLLGHAIGPILGHAIGPIAVLLGHAIRAYSWS